MMDDLLKLVFDLPGNNPEDNAPTWTCPPHRTDSNLGQHCRKFIAAKPVPPKPAPSRYVAPCRYCSQPCGERAFMRQTEFGKRNKRCPIAGIAILGRGSDVAQTCAPLPLTLLLPRPGKLMTFPCELAPAWLKYHNREVTGFDEKTFVRAGYPLP